MWGRLESKAGSQEALKEQAWTREVSMGMERLGTLFWRKASAWVLDSTAGSFLSLTRFLKNAPLAWTAFGVEVQGPDRRGQRQRGTLIKNLPTSFCLPFCAGPEVELALLLRSSSGLYSSSLGRGEKGMPLSAGGDGGGGDGDSCFFYWVPQCSGW